MAENTEMAENTGERISHYREEVARLERTIADVEQTALGPLRHEVLEILRSSLRLNRRMLADLERNAS
jgi:hypothetical protein